MSYTLKVGVEEQVDDTPPMYIKVESPNIEVVTPNIKVDSPDEGEYVHLEFLA